MAVLFGVTGEDVGNMGRERSNYKCGSGSQACSVSSQLELTVITALDDCSIFFLQLIVLVDYKNREMNLTNFVRLIFVGTVT